MTQHRHLLSPLTLRGHRTSFSLEDAFWQEIRVIAEHRSMAVASLIAEIDENGVRVTERLPKEAQQ